MRQERVQLQLVPMQQCVVCERSSQRCTLPVGMSARNGKRPLQVQSRWRRKRARCPAPERTSVSSDRNAILCSPKTSRRYATVTGSGGVQSTNVLSIPTCPFSFLIRDHLLHPSWPDLGSPPSMNRVKPASRMERPSIDTATQSPSSCGPNVSATHLPRGSSTLRKNTAQATIRPAAMTVPKRRSVALMAPVYRLMSAMGHEQTLRKATAPPSP